MKQFSLPDELRETVLDCRADNETVGFVPTMGALHDGHRKVLSTAVEECDRVVASIFVNPTQFDTDEDAEVYPRQLDADREVLRDEGVDFCFTPKHETMYPEGDVTTIRVELPLTDRYEGEIRPRFFDGVARIVSKFFNIMPTNHAYFGEKDLQQYLMLKRMVRDLHFEQSLRSVPVARQDNGVAFSSRNEGFSEEDWETASDVFSLMERIKSNDSSLDRADLSETFQPELNALGMDVQYLDVVSLPEYEPCEPSEKSAVLIVAGYVGEVRLKDNLPLHFDSIRAMESAGELTFDEG
jgi:pantoate--beta-alanine ligase